MTYLDPHGRVHCTQCFSSCHEPVRFDITRRTEGNWRITMNPLAWGNINPEVIILGFSKGPTQAGALASTDHDQIAYKGSRSNVGKILRHVGLIEPTPNDQLTRAVSKLIADRNGRFHFGSLVRCTVERLDKGVWNGSGGGMLDKFVKTGFGTEISTNCTSRFLKNLPTRTKLIVMFGMGSKLNYVQESFRLYQKVRGGDWHWVNEVAYTDDQVTVVHVEHFASLGNLIPRWLGEQDHERKRYGLMATSAIRSALA